MLTYFIGKKLERVYKIFRKLYRISKYYSLHYNLNNNYLRVCTKNNFCDDIAVS